MSTSPSSRLSSLQLPGPSGLLGSNVFHGHGRSNSDQGTDYSAKVSDFEAADSGSVDDGRRNPVVMGEESDEGDSSDFTAQVSDQSSSGTDVDSESEASSYSGLESESLQSVGKQIVPHSVTNVFLTQGKRVCEAQPPDLSSASKPSLIKAAECGDTPLVMKMISKGCDLDGVDSNGRTALHMACSLGRLEIVKLLVKGGANVDAASTAGQTPLHEACVNGRYAVLQEMISEVVDLDMVDNNGLSAAHYCAMNGEVKCLSLLCNQVCLSMSIIMQIHSTINSHVCTHKRFHTFFGMTYHYY